MSIWSSHTYLYERLIGINKKMIIDSVIYLRGRRDHDRMHMVIGFTSIYSVITSQFASSISLMGRFTRYTLM
jgi:hypothetical protein